ncbi:S-acyl fatty acid synthase thioesterase, medium chain [Rhynchocyon petersi]
MEGRGKARNDKVVNCLFQNPNAIFRLICFPWAGAGSIYFARWGKKIHDSIEVYSIRLAGRESRHEEPFASDIRHVAEEIACALLPVLQDKPFAFFGHSMGSYIAFMTALQLKEKHEPQPMHLFVSAWKDTTSGNVDIHRLPGNHFYLLEPSNETFIKNYITKCLELSTLSC